MSGAIKYFFETIFHPCEALTRGRPYGLLVKAGTDGSGAVLSVERIVTGLGWREVQPAVVAVGELTDDHLAAARELGGALAATIAFDLG